MSRIMTEETIFAAAIEIERGEKRNSYLDEACGHDAAMRARLEQLIAAHETSNKLVDQPIDLVQTRLVQGPEHATGPGSQIDRYKLLQEIGEGGFGIVYMAEQVEPIRRRVALKIIKPGMDSREVVARFEAERQALAMMDHPNIAQVFDAGTTESGHPYFVMELVKGVPVTEYADNNQLSAHDRLRLFIDVCLAVQHAHHKGVIHRDLKPSNILVTLHDGVPVPKVIDFGVSKALNQQLTEKTLFTRYGQIIGTPQYMSPEQAELSGLDVDTRSDVYSLGVLLYEMLTGRPPFDGESLRAAGFDQMRKMIREREPQKPSERLRTLDAKTASTVASSRSSQPKTLTRFVRGELDLIVMKSLEKNRERRFDSAGGFARELQRYLAGEAIHTAAPSPFYLLWKSIQKHRASFSLAATIFLITAIAAVASYGMYLQALHGRNLAQKARIFAEKAQVSAEESKQELIKKDRLAGRSLDLFYSVFTSRDSSLELLDRVVEQSQEEFKDSPQAEYDINYRIGKPYIRKGGFPTELFERQRELSDQIYGKESLQYAESLRYIGYCKSEPELVKQAIEIEREILDGKAKFQSLSLLGELYIKRNEIDQAIEPLCDSAEQFEFEEFFLTFSDNPFLWLSEVYRRQGKPQLYIDNLSRGLDLNFRLQQKRKKLIAPLEADFDDSEWYWDWAKKYMDRNETYRSEWFYLASFRLMPISARDVAIPPALLQDRSNDWQYSLFKYLLSESSSDQDQHMVGDTGSANTPEPAGLDAITVYNRYDSLGQIYRKMGLSQLATTFYQGALEKSDAIAKADIRIRKHGWACCALGRTWRDAGYDDRYQSNLRKAMQEFESTDNQWDILWVKLELAIAISKSGGNADSEKLFLEVIAGLEKFVTDPNQDLWSEQSDWYAFIASHHMIDKPIEQNTLERFWSECDELSPVEEQLANVTVALLHMREFKIDQAFENISQGFGAHNFSFNTLDFNVLEILALRFFADSNRADLAKRLIKQLVQRKDETLYWDHPQKGLSRISYARFLIERKLEPAYAKQLLDEAGKRLGGNPELNQKHRREIEQLEQSLTNTADNE